MIDILLAAYNGERYLSEQIDSIRQQSLVDWSLLVSDDGSKDNTIALINKYCSLDDRIHGISTGIQHGDAKKHFLDLLRYSDHEYFAFCDQDDWWKPNKLEVCLRAMQKLEQRYGSSCPLLVYTDMTVTDNSFHVIAPSFLEQSGKKNVSCSLNELLTISVAAGCTIMGNAALREITLKHLSPDLEDKILMHDWWLLLIAASCGHALFLNIPTVLYRQHGDNEVGSEPYSVKEKICHFAQNGEKYWRSCEQADALLMLYGLSMPIDNRAIVSAYANTLRQNPLVAVRQLCRYNLLKKDPLKRIAQILVVLFIKPQTR